MADICPSGAGRLTGEPMPDAKTLFARQLKRRQWRLTCLGVNVRTRRAKESDDSFAPLQKKWGGADAIEIIDVNEVIVPDEMPEPDPDLVGDIAESIRIIGLIHPIPVRSHPTALGRKTETILVTGRARLAAYKLLGRTYIPCAVFPDDDVADRFIRLSENLFRQSATALREAEDIAEFVRHIEALKLSLSGQNVQRGRPRGAVSRAAEQLPIEAKTAEARQKKIERAIKIDQIIPEIKEEIRKRHLDDNQSAVLAIAEKPSILEQRKAVQRLGRDRPTRKTALEARMAETMTSDEQERYKIILAAWGVSAELKSAWRGATKEQRERFINEVLRGPHYDAEGAITLVKNAFAARKQILVQDLHRLGARYGFTKKVISRDRQALENHEETPEPRSKRAVVCTLTPIRTGRIKFRRFQIASLKT